MNYNTDQWLIFNYPLGAGGKFLTSCFFQFDNVAHWAGQQLTTDETINWYSNSIPAEGELWPNKEIDTPWILPEISRAWPRGVNTTESEFNRKMSANDNTYFNQCWSQGLTIPDFWHKFKKPLWWTNATWISIYVDDMSLYKKIMFSKLFEYNNNTIIDTSQRPEIGRIAEQQQKAIFQNQWKWDNITDPDEFFNTTIMNFPYMSAWNFTQPPDNTYITLTELLNVDLLYKFMIQFEDRFKQKISKRYITELHNIWKNATLEKVEL